MRLYQYALAVCVCVCVCVCMVCPALPLSLSLSLSLSATDQCVCVWLRADVSQWSGKLQQTYSCRLTLWLIWSVISPVFHFNRCDHSAVAGLSDLIKINSGVTGLPTELPPPPQIPESPQRGETPSLQSISTCKSSHPANQPINTLRQIS